MASSTGTPSSSAFASLPSTSTSTSTSTSDPVPLHTPNHIPLIYNIPLGPADAPSAGTATEARTQPPPPAPALKAGIGDKGDVTASAASSSTAVPWKIRWACYTVPVAPSAAAPAGPLDSDTSKPVSIPTVPSARSSATTATTATPAPASGTPTATANPLRQLQLQLPSTASANRSGQQQAHTHTQTRPRADSNVSTATSSGRPSKRARLHAASSLPTPPVTTEQDKQYQALFHSLRETGTKVEQDILERAKEGFLQVAADCVDQSSEDATGGTARSPARSNGTPKADSSAEKADELEEGEEVSTPTTAGQPGSAAGQLPSHRERNVIPDRLASIDSHFDVGVPPAGQAVTRRLWLFTRQQYSDPSSAEATSPPTHLCDGASSLALVSSGTFSHADLFPSLYDVAGACTLPSQRLARSLASSLDFRPDTGPAGQASEAYTVAVRRHLLQETKSRCRLADLGLGAPLPCGSGLVYPALRRAAVSQATDPPRGLFISYDLHYDQAGIVASAFLRPVALCSVLLQKGERAVPSSPASAAHPATLARLLPNATTLTLSPLGVGALFLRYCGRAGPDSSVSVKQLEKENEDLVEHARKWCASHEAGLGNDSSSQGGGGAVTAGERWILCKIAHTEVVWPARFCLVSSEVPALSVDEAVASTPSDGPHRSRRAKPDWRSLKPERLRHEELATSTSNYVERVARERERERRERAERSLGGPSVGTGASQPPAATAPTPAAASTPGTAFGASPGLFGSPSWTSTPSSVNIAASPNQLAPVILQPMPFSPSMGRGAPLPPVATAPPRVALLPVPEVTTSAMNEMPTQSRSLNTAFSMLPTLGCIASWLPPIPPIPVEDGKPGGAVAETGLGESAAAASGQLDASGTGKEGAIYSTPQSTASAPTNIERAPIPSNNEPLSVQADPPVESFDDFIWSSYPTEDFFADGSGSMDVTTAADALPTSSFFHNDSNFFESGLTDEDFSFFDTPVLGHSRQLELAAPVSESANVCPSDDLAFITSSEPLDLFGHLMPSGDSPFSPAGALPASTGSGDIHAPNTTLSSASITSPRVALDVATPASSSSALLGQHRASASPAGLAALFSTASPGLAISPSASDMQPYRPSAAFSPLLTTAAELADKESESRLHPPCDIETHDVAAPAPVFEYGLQLHHSGTASDRFAPITFRGSSGPNRREAPMSSQDRRNALIALHRQTRATVLRQRALIGTVKLSRPPQQTVRNWTRTTSTSSPESLIFDDSSSSNSSSSESEAGGSPGSTTMISFKKSDTRLDAAVSPLSPSILLAGSDMVYQLSRQTSGPGLSALPEKRSSDKVKPPRTEREALATVLFQQYLENVDLRERARANIRKRPSLAPLPPVLSSCRAAQVPQPVPSTLISVYHHSATMKMSPASLSFWDKLGLQPCSGKKDVQALVLAASSLVKECNSEVIENWLVRLGTAYHGSHLGKHTVDEGGTGGKGIYIVDWPDKALSELTEYQEKLNAIATRIHKDVEQTAHAVIYVLVTDQECESPTPGLVQLCLRLHLLRRGLVPHIVPSSMLSRSLHLLTRFDASTPACSNHTSTLKRLAFAIYERLPVTTHRQLSRQLEQISAPPDPASQTAKDSRTFSAPAFKIAPPARPTISFSTAWPPPTLDILERHRQFHVAYAVTSDARWLLLAAVDENGELHCLRVRFVEGLDTKLVLKRVWNFAKEHTEPVNVEWRINVVKAGSVGIAELQAWQDLLNSSIASLKRPVLFTVGSLSRAACPTSISSDIAAVQEAMPSIRKTGAGPGGKQPDLVYLDDHRAVRVSFATHPIPVYEDGGGEPVAWSVPRLRRPLLHALASSTTYFVPRQPKPTLTTTARTTPASSRVASYSVHLLLTVAHPASSCTFSLSRHLADLASSFVHLQTLTKHRWSISESDGDDVDVLPWHLAAVCVMSSSRFDAYLP